MNKIWTQVTDRSIHFDVITEGLPSPEHGAMNVFVGVVRDKNLGRSVTAIEYDCYVPLCQKVFHDLALKAAQRWDETANVRIVHSHGKLLVGEVSVVIAATSRHRDESFKIVRYIIEEIKIRAPIWKKEFYTDGETEWVRGHALCQHSKVDRDEKDGDHSCGR